MKISEQWLREWVTTREDTKALAASLTRAGLEVGSVLPVAPPLDRVVVGEILALTPHPQAERLNVCRVDAGQKVPLTIVCGAANAAVGMKVPVALPGAILRGGVSIAETAIRGVNSSGMLCSAAELGLAESATGLLVLERQARPGMSLTKYLQLDDTQIEVELTPNRGDCLSIRGLARELAAIGSARMKAPKLKAAPVKSKRKLAVKLSAKKSCARYAGRVIEGIDPEAESPMWLKERLRRGGIRSIHPVVDITNYVMLELGQPMHAFDLDRLHGAIVVRQAIHGEPLELLDGKTVKLDKLDLVIADNKQPLALAGIMGGQGSSVTDTTRHIFLESAWFRPEAIGMRARHYGLHSESSHRFERGVDPELQREALERATSLVLALCGGKAGPIAEAVSNPELPKRNPILLREERIERVLGLHFSSEKVRSILGGLGMKLSRSSGGKGSRWKVIPPSWRFDISREVDLIEELARINGYDKIAPRLPTGELRPGRYPEATVSMRRMRTALIDRDYQEAITYSFVDPALQVRLSPQLPVLRLANPISAEMAEMRSTLWPGLIQALQYNLNRQQGRVRFFEIGRRYGVSPDNKISEIPVISGIVTGTSMHQQWGSPARVADFFDVKADVEALMSLGGMQRFSFRPATNPAFHPGQSAEIVSPGSQKPAGFIGLLHPEIQSKIGLDQPVIMFEVEISAIFSGKSPKFTEISRFPSVRRDIAIVLDRKIISQNVIDLASAAAGPLLVNLELFDEYRGEGIDSGRKSLALGLTFQDSSRTLNDEDVEKAVQDVLSVLASRFGAQLRQ